MRQVSKYVLDEARVGLDACAFAFDEVKGGVIRHVVRVDEVRDDYCSRARHTLYDTNNKTRHVVNI